MRLDFCIAAIYNIYGGIFMHGYKIFHEALMNRLIENVRRSANANTYIFEGAEGLCRHDAARLFAHTLVCENENTAPCGVCRACIEAKAGSHPDIIHITKEKGRATLGVGPIRDMITECLIKPFHERHKVFIIDDGDALTTEAQNAFLKIIEEPPEYAVFIIVCTSAELLLQTVRSRSVIITFPPVSDDTVRNYIETNYPDETRIDFLVRYCAGIPKAADNIISRSDFEQLRDDALGLTPKILSQKKIHAFAAAKYFDANKDSAAELCDIILMYLRDALVFSMGATDKIINTDKYEKISLLASTYSPALIARAADEIILAKNMINRYVKGSAAVLHAALKTRL